VLSASIGFTSLIQISCAESADSGALESRQPEILRASDPRSGAFFGSSLAASGDTAIVGARGHGHAGSRAGAAYLFERTDKRWREITRLTASDASADDEFGYHVDIDGSRALVGAPKQAPGSLDRSRPPAGAVYLFERRADGWHEASKWSVDEGVGSEFGRRVAIEGERAVVVLGKDRRNLVQPDKRRTAQTKGQGSAIVFERGSGGTWSEIARLAPSRTHDDLIDGFGSAVDLTASTVVVGAQREDSPAGKDSGAVHLFEESSGKFEYRGSIAPSTAYAKQEFGACLAIDGPRLIVGSLGGQNSLTGGGATGGGDGLPPVAFVFERSGGNWVEVAALHPRDRSRFDRAGCPVALAGDMLAVGAPADDSVQKNQGAAYIFRRSGAGWEEVAKVMQRNEITTEEFGSALALSPDTILSGAHRDLSAEGTATGSVYAFPL